MDLNNKLENSTKEILTKEGIEQFIKDIEERLKKMENEVKTYTVDRVEGDIAVCENRDTKEMINFNIEDLPEEIKEGSIIAYKDGKFHIDEESRKEIEDRIKQKMDDLWN